MAFLVFAVRAAVAGRSCWAPERTIRRADCLLADKALVVARQPARSVWATQLPVASLLASVGQDRADKAMLHRWAAGHGLHEDYLRPRHSTLACWCCQPDRAAVAAGHRHRWHRAGRPPATPALPVVGHDRLRQAVPSLGRVLINRRPSHTSAVQCKADRGGRNRFPLLTPMYGPAVRRKRVCRGGGERSCINVSGL